MDIIDMQEHMKCFHFDTAEKPAIELVKIAKGTGANIKLHANEIVFFLEGRLRFTFKDFPDYEGMKGQIVFLPAEGEEYSYRAVTPTVVMVFRIYDPIRLCDNFSIEKLYGSKPQGDTHKPRTRHYSVLEINARVWYLLDGVNDLLADGIRCRNYFDLKIREFFQILRFYYSKEDIYDFFYLILSGDTAFSEYVRQKWHRYNNIAGLAESMHLTPRQFTVKFKEVFGQTPGRWMLDGKAKLIRQQLTATQKPIKQIAYEHGFAAIPQLTKFCKKELGGTPTEIRAEKPESR